MKDNFKKLIEDNYKYNVPSPIQASVIELLFNKINTIAISETGSGKTFAYLIPLVQSLFNSKIKKHPRKAIIILPTKELEIQIFNEFNLFINLYTKNFIKAKLISNAILQNSKNPDFQNFLENTEIFVSFPLKKITTPKKALEILELNNSTLNDNLDYLILDEADRFFDMGFIEIVDSILDKIKDFNVCRGFFSATLLEEVEEIITNHLFNPVKVSIGVGNIPAKTIQQKIIYCTNEEGKLIGIRNLIREGFNPPILVFCEKIEKVENLYNNIKYFLPNISYIHSGLDKGKREEIMKNYRLGKIWILICTDVISRGIDFKTVNLVINYDCPFNAINYIHRIGRTGRAGNLGKSITFVTDDDKPRLKKLSKIFIKSKLMECPNWILKMAQ